MLRRLVPGLAILALAGCGSRALPVQPTTTTSGTAGDAEAGAVLFKQQGCSGCHTLTRAGATGRVGPNLDKLAADARTANRGDVAAYTRQSIASPDAYVVPGFPAGVMPAFGQILKPQQIDDLVAYLL